jgi:hypothetical protein
MKQKIRSVVPTAVLAAFAAVLAACSDDPAGPGPRATGNVTATISGAEARAFDGTSVFHLGSNPHQGGALEFTLGLQGKGVSDRDLILVYGSTALPPVGAHRIGLGNAPYHAFNSRGAEQGPALVAYAADDGELVITHSSPNLLQGHFRYQAFRYCRITDHDQQEGPCSIPASPIPGAPRIEVSGTFSAVPHDQLPIDTVTVRGAIDFYHDPVVIDVPESVQRGTSFTIRVRTYGDGCTSKARTDVKVEGRRVTVEPMNTEIRGVACTQILLSIEHTATVTFDSPGPVQVVVRGRRQPGDDVVTFERTVQVR